MPAARQGSVKEEAQALSVCSGHKYDLLAMRWEVMGFPATRVAISVAPWPFRIPAGALERERRRAVTSLEPRSTGTAHLRPLTIERTLLCEMCIPRWNKMVR